MTWFDMTQHLQLRQIAMNIAEASGERRGIKWSDDALQMMASGRVAALRGVAKSFEQIRDEWLKELAAIEQDAA